MRLASITSRPVRARNLLLQLAAAALLLAGCGGGGSSGPSSGGTGAGPTSFAAGHISGFGSVIVNGVRFDDSAALVLDDDGNRSSRDALKLGMGVEIHGGSIGDDGKGPRAAATEIRHGAELLGPVSAVDAVAKTLVVLGQTVRVLDTTVFHERLVGGFAGIVVGAVVEVHGTFDAATGAYTATRVSPSMAAEGFRIRGIVSNLDVVAKTFTMGPALISYAAVMPVPANLVNGALIRVRLQTVQVGGAWVADRIDGLGQRHDDANEVELKGTITAFTSQASFSVNGIPVDASGAVFGNGAASLALGARVEVKGSSANGVVIATRVSVEDEQEHRAEGFELHGAITAIDTLAKTFVLREIKVSYAAAGIEYRKGTEAQLAVGVQLEVKGKLSADGTMLRAERISFGD